MTKLIGKFRSGTKPLVEILRKTLKVLLILKVVNCIIKKENGTITKYSRNQKTLP